MDDRDGIVERRPGVDLDAPEDGATAGIEGYSLAEDPDGKRVLVVKSEPSSGGS